MHRENAFSAATDDHGNIPEAVKQDIEDEFAKGFTRLAKEERKAAGRA